MQGILSSTLRVMLALCLVVGFVPTAAYAEAAPQTEMQTSASSNASQSVDSTSENSSMEGGVASKDPEISARSTAEENDPVDESDLTPTIKTQPESAKYVQGDSAADLRIVAQRPASGVGTSGTLTYQWYVASDESLSDAQAIKGETYTTFPVSTEQTGYFYYYCEVTNTYKGVASVVRSHTAKIQVTSAHAAAEPQIMVQPQSEKIEYGGSFEELAVVAKAEGDGAGELTYQWYTSKNEEGSDAEPVEGATESYWAPDFTDAGVVYAFCRITNHFNGSTEEAIADTEVVKLEVSDTVSIRTAEDLVQLRKNVNDREMTYKNVTVKLENDIDLSSVCGPIDDDGQGKGSWISISNTNTSSKQFAGTFDGGYHTIYNFYLEKDGTIDTSGLFYRTENGAIFRNLILEGYACGAGSSYTAALVSTVYDATFENIVCNVEMDMNCYFVGGICAYASGNTEFINCANLGDITNSYNSPYTGGISAYYYPSTTSNAKAQNCYNTGNITTLNGTSSRVGGLFGYFVYAKMENCFSSSIVQSPASNAGILVGYNSGSTYTNSYAVQPDLPEGDETVWASNDHGTPISSADAKDPSFAQTLGKAYYARTNDYPALDMQKRFDGAPVITKQPKSAEYQVGQNPTALSVEAYSINPSAAISYQWFRLKEGENAEAISGATQAIYTPQRINGDIGYYCQLTANANGSSSAPVNSDTVQVFCYSGVAAATPSIDSQPESMEGGSSDDFTLKIGASVQGAGAGKLSYQWWSATKVDLSDASAIQSDAARQAEYNPYPSNLKPGTTKYYYCVVTNNFEPGNTADAVSEVATLSTESRIYVSTAEELIALRNNVNSGITYENCTIYITNDIDVTKVEEDWTPIGNTGSTYFYGSIEGGYHSIKFNSTKGGLINYWRDSKGVSNLYLDGTLTINTYVSGTVFAPLAQYISYQDTKISNVISRVSIEGDARADASGLIGEVARVSSESNLVIEKCAFKGNCALTMNISRVAGILFTTFTTTSDYNITIIDCYNSADIVAGGYSSSYYSAGLVGKIPSTNLKMINCFNVGKISNVDAGKAYNYTIAGSMSGTIENCYALDGSASYNTSGCILQSDSDMRNQLADKLGESFVQEEGSYPLLAWEGHRPITISTTMNDAYYQVGEQASPWEAFVSAIPSEGETVSYKWYESADKTMDEADTLVGTEREFTPSTSEQKSSYYYCVGTYSYMNSDGNESIETAVSDFCNVEVGSGASAMSAITKINGEDNDSIDCEVYGEIELSAQATFIDDNAYRGNMSYQWYKGTNPEGKDFAPVPGATNATIDADTTSLGDIYYYCQIRNGLSTYTVETKPLHLFIYAPEIATLEDLEKVRDNVNSGRSYEGITLKQTHDIDMSEKYGEGKLSWEPIGVYTFTLFYSSVSSFKGNYDGGGHSITGLYINVDDSSSTSYHGLFGCVGSVSIKNLHVDGNIHNTSKSNMYAGGIVGNASNGDCEFENLISDVDITGTFSYTGGVVGDSTGNTTFTNCGNRGDINLSGTSYRICGIASSNSATLRFYNCYNTGNLSNSYNYSYDGGVYGIADYAKEAYGCYNAGLLTAPNFRFAIAANGSSTGVSIANYSIEGDYSTSKPTSSVDFGHVEYVSNLDLMSPDVVNSMNAATNSNAFVMDVPSPRLRFEVGDCAPVIESQSSVMESYVQGDRPATASLKASLPGGVEGDLSYQWYVAHADDLSDAQAIEGETSPDYVAQTASMPVGRNYVYCQVTCTPTQGEPASARACYSVYTITSTIDAETPIIAMQPKGATYDIDAVSKAAPLSMGVADTVSPGIGEYTYQWYSSASSNVLGALPIEGATGSTYTPDISEVGSSYYFCVVTNTLEEVKTASTYSDVAEVVSYNATSASPIVDTNCEEEIIFTIGADNDGTSISAVASTPQGKPGNGGELSIVWYRSVDVNGTNAVEVGRDSWEFDITSDADALPTGSYYYYGIVTNTFYVDNNAVQSSIKTQALHANVVTSTEAAYPVASLADTSSRSYTQGNSAEDLSVKLDSFAIDEEGQNATSDGIGVVTGQWFRSQDNSTSTADDDVAIADPFSIDSPANAIGSTYTQAVSTLGYDGTWYFYCRFTNAFENVKVVEGASDTITITVEPKYNIYSADDLRDFFYSIGDYVDGDWFTYRGYTAALRNDIDLSDEFWTGYTSTMYDNFEGIFDGCGHTISGMTIDYSGSNSSYMNPSLFGSIANATIRNLIVKGDIDFAYNTYTLTCVGGIAAVANNSVIENCKFEGNINFHKTSGSTSSNFKNEHCTGGIVGSMSGTLKNCAFEGTIDTYNTLNYSLMSAGGIVGSMNGTVYDEPCSIDNCYAKGTVLSNRVGGIVGTMGGDVSLTNCYFNGEVGSFAPHANDKAPGAIASGVGCGYTGTTDYSCNYSNNYYNKDLATADCGINGNIDGNHAVSTARMLQGDFVDDLNNGSGVYVAKQGSSPVLSWETADPSIASPVIISNSTLDQILYPDQEASQIGVTATLPADSKGVLSYQWYSANEAYGSKAIAIPGATNNTYCPNIKNESLKPDEMRYYWCVVTNKYGDQITSSKGAVSSVWVISETPASAPSITSQDVFDKEYIYGTTVPTTDYMTVTVDDDFEYSDGADAIKYQWYTTTSKDDLPQSVDDLVSDKWAERAISGANTYRYINSDVTKTPGDKYYFCAVTNTYQGCKTSMALSDVSHFWIDNKVKVSTYEDLKIMCDSSATYEGVTVSIENDITWSGNGGSIGNFRGVMEGNGHTISGIKLITQTASVFSTVQDAVVRNIVFKGTSSAQGPATNGLLVYQCKGSEFINVGCDFTLSSTRNTLFYESDCMSAFVRYVDPSPTGKGQNLFMNCYAKCDFNLSAPLYGGGHHNMGAFVGSVSEGSNALFENCYFNGSIKIETASTDPLRIGTFAKSISSDTVIRSCYTSVSSIEISGHPPATTVISPIDIMADGAQVINSFSEFSNMENSTYKVNFDNGMPLFNEGQGMTRAEILNQEGTGAYITIPGYSNPRLMWEGEASAQYSIADIPAQSYTGSAIEPEISVVSTGQPVNPSSYRLLYLSNVDPGTASVYAILQDGTYCMKNFEITGSDLSVATIDPIPVQAYTSIAVKPAITVRVGDVVLTEGKDYVLAFSNNTNVGTATITVSGLGAYKDQSIETTFQIEGELDPVVYISSAEELAALAKDVDAGLITQGRTFVLTNDIDLSSVCYPASEGKQAVNWTPIGGSKSFKGTFDGRGHTISNIYINFTTNYTAGLFRSIDGATIKDLTINGEIASKLDAAGFVVEARNSSLENLVNEANVSWLGVIDSTYYYAGIVAEGGGSNTTLTISNCVNKGAIKGAVDLGSAIRTYRVGGILGTPYYATTSINNCYNLGDLSGYGVGGLVGSIYSNYERTIANVSNCYNAGHIELLRSAAWGPLIAYANPPADGSVPSGMGAISNNYYLENNVSCTTDIPTGFACTGQYSQTESQMKANESSANATINALNIGEKRYVAIEGSYPALRFENATRAIEGEGGITVNGVEDVLWTGDPMQLGGLSVSDASGSLVEGVDYVVNYSDNIDIGTATATISFVDKYYDSIEKTFQILDPAIQIDSESIQAEAVTSHLYKGVPISSEIDLALTYTTPAGTEIKLVEGDDYAVSFKDNDAPGTATATITGRGRFAGTRELGFEIIRMSLGDGGAAAEPVSVEVPGSWFYTGSPIEPVPVVKYGDETLKLGTDFTCAYSNNVEVGTQATVTVTAAGYYAGSCEATFEIQQPVFGGEGSSVAIAPIGPQTYTGSQIRPEVTLVSNGEAIDASAFEVTYGANTDVATGGTVTVATREGSPYGEGSITAAFEIEPLDFSADAEVVEATAESAYTGSPVYASSVKVALGGRELAYGSDYVVDPEGYADNVDAGEARLAVVGAGNYSGSVLGSYAIAPADASEAVVSCDGGTYTGSPVEPGATVRFNGSDVTDSFDVSYEDNVDAGEATVRATAKAGTNFAEGTSTSSAFAIEKGAGPSVHGVASTPESIEGYTKDGTIQGVTESMEWRPSGSESWAPVEGDSVAGLACGTYEVRHAETANTFAGDPKAVAVSATDPQVRTLSASAASVALGAVTYGTTKAQAVTVGNTGNVRQTGIRATSSNAAVAASVNAASLEPGASLSLNVSATKANVGTYSSDVKVTSSENPTGVTVRVTLTVSAKQASALTIEGVSSKTYTGSAQTQAITVKDGSAVLAANTHYTVSYANNVNAGTATVTVTGKGNYSGTKSASFQIAPMAATPAVRVAQASVTYAGKAVSPAVTVTAAGRALAASDYAVAYSGNAAPGRATVKVTLRGNYAGSGSATFNILPKKVTVKAPVAAKKALTVKWAKGSGVTGYEILVATNKKFTAGKKTVKVTKASTVSKKVTGLKSKKTYYVKIRAYKAVGSTKLYSAWSAVKSKKTK